MIYNYARFGSVFDFGIQYSLTINDFTAAQYHTHFVLIGFFNYLLAVPSFIPVFPFFDSSSVETFFPAGILFCCDGVCRGAYLEGASRFVLRLWNKSLQIY